MTKPRCETCPWWTRRDETYSCHHHASIAAEPTPLWWCSLHPDAPKPVYEVKQSFDVGPHTIAPEFGRGWEPINIAGDDAGNTTILWRRIIGYTEGDDE